MHSMNPYVGKRFLGVLIFSLFFPMFMHESILGCFVFPRDQTNEYFLVNWNCNYLIENQILNTQYLEVDTGPRFSLHI